MNLVLLINGALLDVIQDFLEGASFRFFFELLGLAHYPRHLAFGVDIHGGVCQ